MIASLELIDCCAGSNEKNADHPPSLIGNICRGMRAANPPSIANARISAIGATTIGIK
jgi:hypothetical protein